MKLKPVEPNGTAPKPQTDTFEVSENEDGSVTFPLTDGSMITLQDPLTEDMLAMEQFALKNEGVTDTAAILKLITLMCIQWGDRTEPPTYEELIKTPFRKLKPDLRRVGYVLKEFFRLEDLLSTNG